MADAQALYETLDVILANLPNWDQDHYSYSPGLYRPNINECGTTQCIAGFRCLMDGLVPLRGGFGCYVDPVTGIEVYAWAYAAARFRINGFEEYMLFNYRTNDPAALKERIDEIVAGKWRDWTPES